MFNSITWRIWDSFEDKRKLMWWTERIVLTIGILAILAGFFCAYRFGEYMQAKRLVEQNWHPVIFQQIKTN